MKDDEIDIREELRTILRYYDKRLDSCTMAEMKSLSKMLMSNMEIDGTIKDFAEFYDTSENNVRATINRRLIDKPRRKVLYPFHKFMKVVPEKWKNK